MNLRVFHVSEEGEIAMFQPRPSPSKFDNITGDVVFGISEKMLHNYLFPKDCPRVTYYAKSDTSQSDKEKYFSNLAEFVIVIEAGWLPVVEATKLHCYEFDSSSFTLLDECAGYYVSYEPVKPIAIRVIQNPLIELLKRKNLTLRVLPGLLNLADEVSKSSLNFSLIRMRNAKQIEIKND